MNSQVPEAPIGVFDSGVGGLTVARRVLDLLPNERIVYVADQAHVPYGGRDLDEVRGFACGISSALFRCGCKAVVMACNVSSAIALESVRALHPESAVLGVIAPGACRASRATKNGRIGVLATAGTVQSGAYTRALHRLNPNLTAVEVACPDFVPLVENGEEASDAANRAAEQYLAPIRKIDADTVILGCTHYPFLLDALRSVWSTPAYVDPAEQTSQELAEQLASASLLAPRIASAPSRHLLTTTGDPEAFRRHLARFLPTAASSGYFVGVMCKAAGVELLWGVAPAPPATAQAAMRRSVADSRAADLAPEGRLAAGPRAKPFTASALAAGPRAKPFNGNPCPLFSPSAFLETLRKQLSTIL